MSPVTVTLASEYGARAGLSVLCECCSLQSRTRGFEVWTLGGVLTSLQHQNHQNRKALELRVAIGRYRKTCCRGGLVTIDGRWSSNCVLGIVHVDRLNIEYIVSKREWLDFL